MRDKRKRNCYVHAALMVTELMKAPCTVRYLAETLELNPNTIKAALRPFRAAGMVRIAGVAPDPRGYKRSVLYEWGTDADAELPSGVYAMVYKQQSDDVRLAAFRRSVRAAAAPRKPIIQDLDRS